MQSELQLWLEEPASRWETVDIDDTDNLDADSQLGAWLDRTEEPGAYRCIVRDDNSEIVAISSESDQA